MPADTPEWQGPNPFEDFQRVFTAEGGIKLIFKVKDLRAWRWWVRLGLWLVAFAGTAWFALRVSPYPLLPRSCPLFTACLLEAPVLPILVNLGLLLLMGWLYATILFVEDQILTALEIRPDCMIVEETDVFWVRHMQLGWPQLGSGPEGTSVLQGAYGTRQVEYLTLYSFEPADCTVALVGAQLRAAMQQLWDQPGGSS